MNYTIHDENDVPRELLEAVDQGRQIQVLTCIGYINCDPDFLVGNTYRIVDKGEMR